MIELSEQKLRVACDNGVYRLVQGQGRVVTDVERFLRAVELRGVSSQTVRTYAYDLLVLYRWFWQRGEEQTDAIARLEQRDLLDFVRFQRAEGASPATINHRLVAAGLLYRFIIGRPIGAGTEQGVNLPGPYYRGPGKDRTLGLHQRKAPRHRALRVKVPRRVIEPLSQHQVRVLVGSVKRYRDLSIVYLMLLCGLRSSEVRLLKVKDVDLDGQTLRVTGKGNKVRVLPLPGLLVGILRDYLRLERPSICRTSALFVVLKGPRRGYEMSAGGLRSLFRYRRRDKSIQNANPHRLRHTFGADMARCGVRLPTLQRMMGHTDCKMTLQYINLSISDIAAEFLRACGEIEKRYAAGR